MESKILSKKILIVSLLAVSVIFAILIFEFFPKNLNHVGSAVTFDNSAPSKSAQSSLGRPARLVIPGINLDSSIEAVGLTPQGAMGVPKGITTTAWYSQGPRPGETGSSVIDGHYGWKKGVAAVFNNINKLRKGDQLYVQDDQGTTIAFVVREIRSFDPQANASEVFTSSDGKAHLNLITCEGTWDNALKSYPQRLVVFTDKE